MTAYIVLRKIALATSDGRIDWRVHSTVEAASAAAAIRQKSEEGTYVAVPARFWKPVRVTTETRTVLKLQADTPPAEAPR